MATAGGHNQAVPSTIERLDMSLDDIIKLQKEATKGSKPAPAKTAKAARAGAGSIGVSSRVQKKQAPGNKKVLRQLQGATELGGIQRMGLAHVANRGRGGRGQPRFIAQGRPQTQSRAQQVLPNGLAQSHRPGAVHHQNSQNRGTRISQPPAVRMKPWVRSQATVRGSMHSQQPQQYNNYGQGPEAGVTDAARWWAQPTARAQSQGKRLMGVHSIYQQAASERVSGNSVAQQSHHSVSLHRTTGGIAKPARPTGRVSSAVFQQPRGSPVSAPRTLNERFSSYKRNAGVSGSTNLGRGGLKVITFRQ